MSRRFKFRVWEPVNKTMHYMGFALWEGVQKRFALPIDKQDLHGCYCSMNLDTVEVMQYMEIKDKNLMEIYEGDIIRFDNTEIGGQVYIGEVIFNDDQTLGCMGWGLWTKKGYLHTDFLGNIEVLGNVWEQPELMNQEVK